MNPLSRLLIFFALSFAFHEGHATHAMGMNISYKHISGDSFEVVLDFYRYCGGTAFNNGNCTNSAGLPNNALYYVSCESAAWISPNQTVPLSSYSIATPICDSLNASINSCLVGPCGYTGIIHAVYRDTLLLDSIFLGGATCDDLLFVYGTGARNSGVNYVSQPGVVAYARLNKSDFPENNSVKMNPQYPIPYFSDGEAVQYSWNAFDLDGDSLWWELDTAWNNYVNGGFNSIQYAGSYTAQNPMPGNVNINHATGGLDFVATIPAGYNFANYAIAVTVKEYDKNTQQYKGEVHRDVQFIVMDSTNNSAPVSISNITSTSETIDSISVRVCYGQDVEIQLIYADYDTNGNYSSDSLNIQCDIANYVSSASYTHTGTNPDTLTISITNYPALSDVFFNVSVEDDRCPIKASNNYTYRILGNGSTKLPNDTTICELDTITLHATGGDTFQWHVLSGDPILVGTTFGCVSCPDPWVHLSQTTTYLVTSNLAAACGNSDTITISVFDEYENEMTQAIGGSVSTTEYCIYDPIDTFNVTTSGGIFSGLGISNQSLGYFDPNLVNPTVGNWISTNIVYEIPGTCGTSDTINVKVYGRPNASISTTGPYLDTLVSVQLLGVSNFSNESWWDAGSTGNPTVSGLFNPSLFSGPDSVLVYHYVSEECENTDSAWVFIDSVETLGYQSISNINEVSVRPNPAQNEVKFVSSGSIINTIAIYDVLGKQMLMIKVLSQQALIDVSQYPTGVYYVETQLNSGETESQKLIIK